MYKTFTTDRHCTERNVLFILVTLYQAALQMYYTEHICMINTVNKFQLFNNFKEVSL